MAVLESGLTLDQFLQLPEEEPALEFAEGVVTQKVSPKGKHSWLQFELAKRLNAAGGEGRLAMAFPELRATFGGASRVPDIAVYRRERIPLDESGRLADDFREPPDAAIEIASPEQSVNAPVGRCLWYVAHGVGVALLVDPADESVLTFRASEPARMLRGDERIDLADLLPSLDLTVAELFATLQVG